MKKQLSAISYQLSAITFLLLTAHCLLLTASAQIAVKGETVYTMDGQAIKNGVVLTNNGKITAVGPNTRIVVPNGYKVIEAKVVTPGLIDAHSVIGLAGYLNQPHDQMQIENSSPIQPELRAIDAYNPEETLIEWVRSLGITTIHTGHAPAALVSGQMMIAKTVGKTVEDAVIIPTSMIAVTLGDDALGSGGKSPGTRAKEAAMLRTLLLKAQESARKSDAAKKTEKTVVVQNTDSANNKNDNSPNPSNPNSMLKNPPTPAYQDDSSQTSTINASSDLRNDIMERVVRREIPLLVTAQKAIDIMTALRIAKEFNIKIVLDGVAEAQLVMNEIKASGFPVVLHPTMYRAGGDTESLSLETAAKLEKAGIPFALQSGYETYVPKTRVVLFEAALTLPNGLNFEQALSTITIDAAKVLGLDKRIGSITVGKDADLAMYDGDPFEYTTHCVGTMIDGKIVSEIVR
ncbi:MAG: amidohydrolase family protein [Aridibacter sp.]